jgi:Syntaxin
LQVSLVAFQRIQQVSAERQRTVVEGVKLAVEEENEACVISKFGGSFVVIDLSHHLSQQHENDSSVEQRQAQLFQSQLSPAELAYQESLIQERESEIREIETGIHELHEIFRDLGSLVNEQGEMLGA